jgi:hypothetical protein
MLPAPVIQAPHRGDGQIESSRDQQIARLRTIFEKALSGIKGILRNRGVLSSKPTCFVSYAWGVELHEKWVMRLVKDLQNADVEILYDRKDNARIGSSIAEFVNRIEDSRYVVVVGTLEYLKKYQNKSSQYGSFVAAEMDILNERLTGTINAKDSVLPVLLAGEKHHSFPPLLRGRVYADFTIESQYFRGLFDLILGIYEIPLDDSLVNELRESLWEDE